MNTGHNDRGRGSKRRRRHIRAIVQSILRLAFVNISDHVLSSYYLLSDSYSTRALGETIIHKYILMKSTFKSVTAQNSVTLARSQAMQCDKLVPMSARSGRLSAIDAVHVTSSSYF